MDNRIFILDVTNRDGVQTSRLGLAKLEKIGGADIKTWKETLDK